MTSVASVWRNSAQLTGAWRQQELHEREADAEGERRDRADGQRHERALGVARLAQAPGAVADGEQHERVTRASAARRVDEQADSEAEAAAGQRAAQQADRHHQERRQVGVRAGDRKLRDRRRLHDDATDASATGGRGAGGRRRHAPCPSGRVRTARSRGRACSRTGEVHLFGVGALVSMREMTPIGSPRGYSDGKRSVSETVPRVSTRSPSRAWLPAARTSAAGRSGLPRRPARRCAKTLSAAAPRRHARRAVSVNSVTCAAPLRTAVTPPISASSLITG